MINGAAANFNEERLMARLRWRIVPYIMLLYVVAVMDRVNLGFAALKMNESLGISASAFGMLAGIFFIAYFFFEVPSNIIMHRVGARRWIARILISWGMVTVLIGFARTMTHVGILRFLLGMAEAGFYPCIILYLTFWFPTRHFAKTISFFMCGQALANITTGPISTWILDNIAWNGMESWRWLFVFEGLPAIILGVVTIFVLTDRPEQATFLSTQEKEWLVDELRREHLAKTAKLKISKLAVFKQARVWHLSWCYICYVVALYGLGMWVPQILRALSKVLSNFEIGLISTIPYICGIIAMFLVARHSDKTQERRRHVGLPISAAFVGLIALTMTSNLWLSLVFICVSTAAIYCFVGTFWTLPNLFLSEATAAVGIAIINSVGNLGGFLGPYAVGFLKDATGSTNAGMYFLASFALMATVSVLLIPVDAQALKARRTAKGAIA
jgi:ACS family tartrate transporter-like MFS transporter